MDMPYLFLIIVTLVLGLGSQALIRNAYNTWRSVPIASGLSGFEAARRMLDSHGLYEVGIGMIDGDDLSDNFDPRTNTLNLSRAVYQGRSVSSVAVACHEAGHAVQHAEGYVPIRIRGAIVPVVTVASNVWILLLLAGIVMNILNLVWAAIILYACVVVFQLVTLPVEFNASARAIQTIEGTMSLPEEQYEGARKVLRSAALTYVAAALASLLQLLYFIGMARD